MNNLAWQDGRWPCFVLPCRASLAMRSAIVAVTLSGREWRAYIQTHRCHTKCILHRDWLSYTHIGIYLHVTLKHTSAISATKLAGNFLTALLSLATRSFFFLLQTSNDLSRIIYGKLLNQVGDKRRPNNEFNCTFVLFWICVLGFEHSKRVTFFFSQLSIRREFQIWKFTNSSSNFYLSFSFDD